LLYTVTDQNITFLVPDSCRDVQRRQRYKRGLHRRQHWKLLERTTLVSSIMRLYVLSSVLWCPLRFPHGGNVRITLFVFVWVSWCCICLSIMVLYLFEYHGVVFVWVSWCCICLSIMVLYLFEYHGVRHMLCCVLGCFRLVCTVLPVSLDCPV
jgi:hypothetical protein